MITLDGTTESTLQSPVHGATTLVEIDFSGGTQRFTNWGDDVVSGGQTYLGRTNLVQISTITESEDPGADAVTFEFPVVNGAMLAACIGAASVWRNRAVRIYLQAMNSSFQPVGTKTLRWQGKLVAVSVDRARGSLVQGGLGTLIVKAQRAGFNHMRRADGLRVSHAQQQIDYPGDLGFQYIEGLIEKPTVWLSKNFQASQ